jgi:two-component system, NarL family, response regulator
VFAGQRVLSPKIASRLANRLTRAELSEREIEALNLLTRGLGNKEIATALSLSEDGVKARMKSLFTKLNVHDRTEAVIAAIRHGIVHVE